MFSFLFLRQELKYGDIATIRSKLMDTVSKGGIAKLASEKVTGNDKDVDMTEIAPCLAQVSILGEKNKKWELYKMKHPL